MSEQLPSYDQPPVVEVAVGTSFERLPVQASARFGAFWVSQLADTFPTVQEHPPYIVPVERFGTSSFAPELTLKLTQDLPSPRFWFLNQAEDELLQLQPDWLSCNWRKVQPDCEYGRWPSRRRAFIQFFSLLNQYLIDAELGPLVPRQCEVTYINHVLPGGIWHEHRELYKILRLVNEVDLGQIAVPEQVQLWYNFAIPDDSGEYIGRLHVVALPGYLDMNKTPIYRLELTARGAPIGDGLKGVIDFLDKGREAIVTTFAKVTSADIQQEWGLR